MGFTAPTGAVLTTPGATAMPYGIALGAPSARPRPRGQPILDPQTLSVITTYVNSVGETTGSPNTVFALPTGSLLTVASPATAGNPQLGGASGWNVYVGPVSQITGVTVASDTATVAALNNFAPGQDVAIHGVARPAAFINDFVLTVTSLLGTGPRGSRPRASPPSSRTPGPPPRARRGSWAGRPSRPPRR